ncbi:MAG: 4Fe-4S binding protein [Planctomycetota bacterium]|jgi:tetratricopeptide (TPR) repeat protein/ferredoxin
MSSVIAQDPPISARRRHFGRWRAGCLALIYLLAGIHIAHWRITGKSLAPLELNEVMHTLELGVITAGFLFMVTAVLATSIFGRFFCSWGCHILALQDGCAWLLARLRIRPKPVRSRLLLLIAPGALIYMFLWPQVTRIVEGRPAPAWRIATDAEGWASFTTTDFWRNLPGPGVTLTTFLVCGGLIIYVLGSRSFCRYACPYGALFGLADRVAPGRILSVGDCANCGRCTAVCKSSIRVHEELTVFGKVVSPSCLKDLDCVDVCPQRAIGFGFARPSGFRSFSRAARKPAYDLTWFEEGLAAASFLVTLLSVRGLYATIPFLLALGIASIVAYGAVVAVRLIRAEHARLGGIQLKIHGRLTRAGVVFAAGAVLATALLVHSAFIRLHEVRGHRAYERVVAAAMAGGLHQASAAHAEAIDQLGACARWGLVRTMLLDRRLATLYLLAGDEGLATPHLERLSGRDPALALELTGDVHACMGRSEPALVDYEAALRHDPRRPRVHRSMAQLLAQRGDSAAAREHLEAAVAIDPWDVLAHGHLTMILVHQDELDGALVHARRSCELKPRDAALRNTLGFVLLRLDRLDEADAVLREAVALDGRFALARLNLGRVLARQGRAAEAERHFADAVRLDPRLGG